MKVLLVANGIYPERIGGIEVCVSKLAERLVDEGHDVTVLLPEFANPYDSPPGFCSTTYYEPKFRLFDNPISVQPYRFIRENRTEFDVVHGHSHLFSGSVLAAKACDTFDIPYLLTSHGLESQTAPMLVNKVYNNTVGRYAFQTADSILTYTSTEVKEIQALGVDAEKIHHITRGIDIDSFNPNFSKQTNPIRLLWVSRFVPGKGPEVVVRAVHHLLMQGFEVELTMIGNGPRRDSIEKLIQELNIGSNVTIRGFVSEDELHKEYRDATFFVLPSVSEGMNRTILESMASGTPVILSDIPHFRSILEGCGKIVEERNGQAFAGAIEEMLNRDLEELSKQCRKRVEGRFTWNHTFNDIIPIYEEATR